MRALRIVALGLLVVSVAACQQSQPASPTGADQNAQKAVGQVVQKAVESASGSQLTVNQSGNSVTVNDTGGNSLTANLQIPDELRNFPVPAGFVLQTDTVGSVTANDGGSTAVAAWSGSGSIPSVNAFYKTAMADRGWTSSMSVDTPDEGVFTFEKAGFNAWVTVETDATGTTISVLYGKSGERPPVGH